YAHVGREMSSFTLGRYPWLSGRCIAYPARLSPVLLTWLRPAGAVLYTLSLHDALPISAGHRSRREPGRREPPRRQARLSRHPGSDRKSTRLNSSHEWISYAVFCLKKKTHFQEKAKDFITVVQTDVANLSVRYDHKLELC